MLLVAGAFASACSTLPPREWPPHEECTIVAEYAVRDAMPIALPLSGPDLTILECSIEPPPSTESFQGDRRMIAPPPQCRWVTVHCHYRVYHRDGQTTPDPATLFPGAKIQRRS